MNGIQSKMDGRGKFSIASADFSPQHCCCSNVVCVREREIEKNAQREFQGWKFIYIFVTPFIAYPVHSSDTNAANWSEPATTTNYYELVERFIKVFGFWFICSRSFFLSLCGVCVCNLLSACNFYYLFGI